MKPSPKDVTQMLHDWSNGNQEALDKLTPFVYKELRRLAQRHLRNERPDHTLQPTALVHEAYLRLVDQTQMRWQDRTHFYSLAANIMRRILIDYARQHRAAKRGGSKTKLPLDEAVPLSGERHAELVALDDALTSLAKIDPQQCRLVELRYFLGLSIEETAEVLGISPATVSREWGLAKAWLHHELKR